MPTTEGSREGKEAKLYMQERSLTASMDHTALVCLIIAITRSQVKERGIDYRDSLQLPHDP